jgi:hypothetical protein
MLNLDEKGNLYEGFMVRGVRSGAGKLTYSDDNKNLESFDGEWADGLKKNGLLMYREFDPLFSLLLYVLVNRSITGMSQLTTNVMAKAFSICQPGLGMKEAGYTMKCTALMGSIASRTYASPSGVLLNPHLGRSIRGLF